MNFSRRPRRHPLDVVYDVLEACKTTKVPTALGTYISLSYIILIPLLTELVNKGLLIESQSRREEEIGKRWSGVIVTPQYRTNSSGSPPKSGRFKRYTTTEKGYEFMKHYHGMAALLGEPIDEAEPP